MVAWWLAGADSKGWGQGETELECPTIGLEGEQFRRVLGARSMAGVMVMLLAGNIWGYETEAIRMVAGAFCRGHGGNIDSTECSSNCGSGDALPEGSGIPFHSVPFSLVEEARHRIGAGWRLARREVVGLGADWNCAGQPAADCLCFGGFRGIEPFGGSRGRAKRGGTGTRSDRSDSESGNRVADESVSARTNSEGGMGDGCRELW
jgi:hypothetical protein